MVLLGTAYRLYWCLIPKNLGCPQLFIVQFPHGSYNLDSLEAYNFILFPLRPEFSSLRLEQIHL